MKIYAKATVFASQEIPDDLSKEEIEEAISNLQTDISLDFDNMQESGSSKYEYTYSVDETTPEKMRELDSYLASELIGDDVKKTTVLDSELEVNKEVSKMRFEEKAYEAYKLDWMMSHGHSMQEFIKEIDEYKMESGLQSFSQNARAWEIDCGFNGECYASINEFLNNDYQDEAYMASILSPTDMAEYLKKNTHNTRYRYPIIKVLSFCQPDAFIEELEDKLPHGSGINGDWDIDYNDGKYICKNSYDHMNDVGMYDCVIPFTLSIPENNILQFTIEYEEKYQNVVDEDDLDSYLEDTFAESLRDISLSLDERLRNEGLPLINAEGLPIGSVYDKDGSVIEPSTVTKISKFTQEGNPEFVAVAFLEGMASTGCTIEDVQKRMADLQKSVNDIMFKDPDMKKRLKENEHRKTDYNR